MTEIVAGGWAIIESGQINVRTVSDTRRSAIVNFLVTDRGMMITNDTTDEQIDLIWDRLKYGAEAHIIHISYKSETYTAANGEELPKGLGGTTIINDGRPT